LEADHLQKPPVTYLVDPTFVQENLNYREMIALSGLFRRWALYDPDITPERATELIKWSSDFERLSKWLGPDWKPKPSADPIERMLFTKWLARVEIESSQPIPLAPFLRNP
jgi:hypothetical protein